MRFNKVVISVFALLLLFPSILFPSLVWAAFVQSKYGEVYPATQCSVTFNNPVTAGNLLVVVLRLGSSDGTATVTSGGRTFTQDARIGPILGDWGLSVHSLANAPGGATTITATKTGSADQFRMSILEYSGIATSSPAHKTTSASATGSTANSGSVTTTIAGCTLVCAVATDSDGGGFSAGPGYTLRTFDTPPPGDPDKTAVEDRMSVATGTYSGVMSINGDTWAAILVAYKPATDISAPTAPTNLHIVPY